MAAKKLSLPEKIEALHETLRKARVPHAFGGALALAYYAEPRATIDIDVNLFVPPKRFESVRKTLAPLGISGDVDAAKVERDGQCRLCWERNPIDLFFAYDKIHDAMKRDVRSVPFGSTKVPILSPEHLLVCKVALDRPKDWLDIEQVLVSVEHLELYEIDEWLARLLGKRDARKRRFDGLAEDLRST